MTPGPYHAIYVFPLQRFRDGYTGLFDIHRQNLYWNFETFDKEKTKKGNKYKEFLELHTE